ncbi:MAG: hypothetical protein H7832_04970 [Magnetococcus sp. DMHC-6]
MLLNILFLPICGLAQTNSCLKLTEQGRSVTLLSAQKKDWFTPGKAPFGVNTLFWVEDDLAWKHSDLIKALPTSGITSLRFPAGEVADNYDWETKSLERKNEWPKEPSTAKERDKQTDYLEFLTYAKKLGIEHIFFVVNVDGAFYAPGDQEKNVQRYAQKAARWVQKVKEAGYRVPYWEIGNEPYLYTDHNPLTALEYAMVVKIFSQAMRAADPHIFLGVAGPGDLHGSGFADQLTAEQLTYLRDKGRWAKKICSGKKAKECVEMLRRTVPGQPQKKVEWWPTLARAAKGYFDFAAIHRYALANLSDFTAKHGIFPFTERPRRLREFLEKSQSGHSVAIALTEWNLPKPKQHQRTQMAHLQQMAIQMGNTLVAGIDFAHYWPLRSKGKDFSPLLTYQSGGMTPLANLFALLRRLTDGAQVGQTMLDKGVYVLRTQQKESSSDVVVNTTSEALQVDISPSLGEKTAVISVKRMIEGDNGKITVLAECSENLSVAQPKFMVSIAPNSVTSIVQH